MITRCISSVVGIFLLCAAPSTAAVYEFDVTCRVEGGLLSIFDLEVGDELKLKYALDSDDRRPDSPNFGVYVGGPASMELPNETITSSGGNLTIKPLSNGMYYQSSSEPYSIQTSYYFPQGTVTSDILPLELPLAVATTKQLSVFASLHVVIFGSVTSYEARLIPEPAVSCLFGCLLLFRRSR